MSTKQSDTLQDASQALIFSIVLCHNCARMISNAKVSGIDGRKSTSNNQAHTHELSHMCLILIEMVLRALLETSFIM